MHYYARFDGDSSFYLFSFELNDGRITGTSAIGKLPIKIESGTKYKLYLEDGRTCEILILTREIDMIDASSTIAYVTTDEFLINQT